MPIRLWIAGTRESHLAHTLDISQHGVQLGGFRGELKIGDKIEIQRGHKRSQFRVVWVRAREGSSEKQIGAECLADETELWRGLEFPQKEKMDEYEEKE